MTNVCVWGGGGGGGAGLKASAVTLLGAVGQGGEDEPCGPCDQVDSSNVKFP